MSDKSSPQNQQNSSSLNLQFGEEVEIEESGFSFCPILGFELEIDGSVYMYSEDGNLEISLMGGALEERISLAELNTQLAADFMENFDEYHLSESGSDTIQGIIGHSFEVRFLNAEEEGNGRGLICSPAANQYFFILMIASAEYWEAVGDQLFDTTKSKIHFHRKIAPELEEIRQIEYPDLTLETYPDISPNEEFILRIEKGDVSLLLAARSHLIKDQITIHEILAPGDKVLYRDHPEETEPPSLVFENLLTSTDGEMCFFFPRDNQSTLQPGDYRFIFSTESGSPLEEIQVIIRSGRALDIQTIDLNFWLASEDDHFTDPGELDQFKLDILHVLKNRLSPMNLTVGEITCFHPAPDELAAFTSVNIDKDLADCSYMIAETIQNRRALNIGIVDRFLKGDPLSACELPSASSGSPGMILSSASSHACILINWSAIKGDLQQLADAIIDQLIVFSGIDIQDTHQSDGEPLTLNREVAWRLRRHPIFYEVD